MVCNAATEKKSKHEAYFPSGGGEKNPTGFSKSEAAQESGMDEPVPFELVDKLDLNIVPGFSTKTAAKKAALRLGRPTWRYVRY